ncbi:transcription/translation regulatory transformer protein RfaH [Pseudomonas sp. R5(2019)]|uniref:transcription/translation regulatory transformer protein RfaH n=1 Tax=Pseudomonas sp. R5(2019) TaxID=2697566 RepID=UPI00141265B0|nr:transcription/translation regulatory transformer protein RfaH [Pseudomonas sp. R5(2019)]NBA98221.1 transcription/translation regulatory transformer protein RfaH [Pseudomonas sp. R5(2019)]
MESNTKAWYLIQCKSRQEERAEENLVRQGYTCFRPQYLRERLAQGKRSVGRESLFPGYLFIQLAFSDNWGPLRSTRGVLRVVAFGTQPLAIADALIVELRLQEEQQGGVELQLVSGESVQIKEGPFAELQAIYLRMDGNERVVLLLNLLNRQHQVTLPLRGIAKR